VFIANLPLKNKRTVVVVVVLVVLVVLVDVVVVVVVVVGTQHGACTGLPAIIEPHALSPSITCAQQA
jgi:hypothetical protein